MHVSGSYVFDAPAEKVWRVLTEPKSLSGCIPGCEGLDPIGGDEYEAVLNVKIGPIGARYNAKIAMRDKVPHQSYRLVISGTGSGSFVSGDAKITLAEQGGKTTVSFEGESQAGGTVARVGQRLMEGVAKSMMDKFFSCMQQAVR
jgi:carbon monoxide dehydrogenase subunit G